MDVNNKINIVTKYNYSWNIRSESGLFKKEKKNGFLPGENGKCISACVCVCVCPRCAGWPVGSLRCSPDEGVFSAASLLLRPLLVCLVPREKRA